MGEFQVAMTGGFWVAAGAFSGSSPEIRFRIVIESVRTVNLA
jgi:hypothetical protein